jgi:aminoglycoside 6'-N-acetyltransferase
MSEARRYSFRPAITADLPMLRDWLATPEVVRWWGNPTEEYALLEEDLGNPLMTMRIVSFGGEPFAYVQDYALASWPQPHFADLPDGGRGIDAFIGVPEMIGQGHGAAFLRHRATQLIAEGASAVAIDPDAQNLRARRAYAKAGFAGDAIIATANGPVVVMVFRGSDADPRSLQGRRHASSFLRFWRCQISRGHGRRAADPNFYSRSPGAHVRRFLSFASHDLHEGGLALSATCRRPQPANRRTGRIAGRAD